jgi:hypothetical protein
MMCNIADRCRRLAQHVTDKDAITELTNMAKDFERKAAEVKPGEVGEVFK